MKLVFVCAANVCRSFMAERILKGLLAKVNRKDILVTSRALYDMKKGSGDSVAAQLLKEKGFSADGHTSTLLDRSIVKESDMILVMEGLHQKIITEQYPESAGKIRFLKSFARDFKDQDQDIRDCYHRSIYHYRLCFSEIYLSIKGLLQCI